MTVNSFWSVCNNTSLSVCVRACVCLTALDAALDFQQQLIVPSTWKTEVKEESSSSEDEDEEEEQEEDATGEEEEEVQAEVCTLSTSSPCPGKEKDFKLSCFLSAGRSGAVPRGARELSAAAVQVYGRQR